MARQSTTNRSRFVDRKGIPVAAVVVAAGALSLTGTGCGSGLIPGANGRVTTADGAVSSADGLVSTMDGFVSTSDGAASFEEIPATDPAQLLASVEYPGEPVGVWFGDEPEFDASNPADTVPGAYISYAVIEYATPEEAADAAGPAAGSEEIPVAWWYPEQLLLGSDVGEGERTWTAATTHNPSPAWVDTVYIPDAAPNFIVFEYTP